MTALHDGSQPCPCRGCTVAFKQGVRSGLEQAIEAIKDLMSDTTTVRNHYMAVKVIEELLEGRRG